MTGPGPGPTAQCRLPADQPISGNVYDKYNTRNPLARHLVDGFLRTFERLVSASGARHVHEIGCGEGYLTSRLAAKGLHTRGCDISSRIIDVARERTRALGLDIPFRVAGLDDLRADTDAAELVVCCEVLEHVKDPVRALKTLRELASPHLLVSVPREPLWRGLNLCRGKYLRDLGNTPGHLHHWSARQFVHFLERQVTVVEVATPLPWTMALCRR